MPKELLIYNDIYDYTAERFVTELNGASGDLTVRINSYGGSVDAGWAMLAKYSEYTGKKTTKVDGRAESMAGFFLCYSDYNECLDVSSFMFHRAAYGYYESLGIEMPEAAKAELKAMNDKLRAALEAKVDVQKFEATTGVTMNELFSMDSRIEVVLNAEQALSVGLVDKVNQLTPQKKSEIVALAQRVDAKIYERVAAYSEPKKEVQPMEASNNEAAIKEAVAKAVAAERDRVGAWLTYNDVDPEAVAKGIKEGESITQTAMAEFSRKAFAKADVKTLEKESATDTPTAEAESAEASAENKELAAFAERFAKATGVNKEKLV